ncbi:unnamed protein product [Zymoseptoria tritici ST99CH_3D1]|nr:unnamed protein product [Zymoseptoria tritici ST99CH_3D1]
MGFQQLWALTVLLVLNFTAGCDVNPDSSMDTFHLVDPDMHPLVRIGNQLQLSSNNLGQEDDAPIFYFQRPASAPQGAYDLILAEHDETPPHWVARTEEGNLVLTDASTGPSGQVVNGQNLVTSVFTIDCDGAVSVIREGKHAALTARNGASVERALTAFNYGDEAFKRRATEFASLGLMLDARSLTKRDAYRCPPGSCAKTKPGARPASSNGCGPEKYYHLVPEFSFTDCCDAHDKCYDSCASPSASYCNNQFHDCMMGKCDQKYHGFSIGIRAGCKRTAQVYTNAVQGHWADVLFTKYGNERCLCKPYFCK